MQMDTIHAQNRRHATNSIDNWIMRLWQLFENRFFLWSEHRVIAEANPQLPYVSAIAILFEVEGNILS